MQIPLFKQHHFHTNRNAATSGRKKGIVRE
jgi:hypothetical protein